MSTINFMNEVADLENMANQSVAIEMEKSIAQGRPSFYNFEPDPRPVARGVYRSVRNVARVGNLFSTVNTAMAIQNRPAALSPVQTGASAVGFGATLAAIAMENPIWATYVGLVGSLTSLVGANKVVAHPRPRRDIQHEIRDSRVAPQT